MSKLIKLDYDVLAGRRVCDLASEHTPSPDPRIESFPDWHRRMRAEGRDVQQCQACGLWVIWTEPLQ